MSGGTQLGYFIALAALVSYVLYVNGVFDSVVPVVTDVIGDVVPDIDRAEDYNTPTAGCARGCCASAAKSGVDCVSSTIPCKDRTDGRNCFKRFIGGVDGCPNADAAGGIVAPPDGYVQFENCWAHL